MDFSYRLLSKYRLQIMGIAILLVVFYHSTVDMSFISLFNNIKTICYGGVDVFFLLSGLGLYYSLKNDFNVRSFYKNRFIRIMPTYIFVILIFSIINKASLKDVFLNITTLGFWINSSNRFDWYIPALIIFYLVTPLIIYFFNKKNKYVVIFLCILAGVLISISISATSLSYLLIFTTRIPIFFIGILIGYWSYIDKKIKRLDFIIMGIMLILGWYLTSIMLTYPPDVRWSYGLWWYPFIFLTLPLCIISAILFEYTKNKINYNYEFLKFCGRFSLEIYLFHPQVFGILKSHFIFDRYGIIENLILVSITLIITIIYRWLINLLGLKLNIRKL